MGATETAASRTMSVEAYKRPHAYSLIWCRHKNTCDDTISYYQYRQAWFTCLHSYKELFVDRTSFSKPFECWRFATPSWKLGHTSGAEGSVQSGPVDGGNRNQTKTPSPWAIPKMPMPVTIYWKHVFHKPYQISSLGSVVWCSSGALHRMQRRLRVQERLDIVKKWECTDASFSFASGTGWCLLLAHHLGMSRDLVQHGPG